MNNALFFSSKSPHWPTPKALYSDLDNEFGFNFDPCPLGEDEKDGSAQLFTEWAGKRSKQKSAISINVGNIQKQMNLPVQGLSNREVSTPFLPPPTGVTWSLWVS